MRLAVLQIAHDITDQAVIAWCGNIIDRNIRTLQVCTIEHAARLLKKSVSNLQRDISNDVHGRKYPRYFEDGRYFLLRSCIERAKRVKLGKVPEDKSLEETHWLRERTEARLKERWEANLERARTDRKGAPQ